MKSRWMKLTVLFFAMLLLAACGGGGGGGGGFIPASGGGNDTTAPTVPTGLVAVGVSTSQINLSWNASTDNVAVTGYRIYRGGTYLKSVSGTSTSDTLVSASTQYCYTVQAYDAANNYSLETTQACASTWSPTGWGSAIRIGDFRFFMSYDLYYPRVALNDTNTAIAAWDEHESFNLGFGHIWSNVYKNGSWGTQVNISLNSQNSGEPSVAINAAGNGVAVWTVWNTTTNTKTIWGSLYSFATNTWSTPVMVSNPSGTNTVFWACEPKVVMDSLGNAVAVWSQSDNNHTYTIWTNRYNGSAWGTPEMLSSGTSLAGEPQLAISGNNNAFAVWRQSIDANLGKTFARIYSAASATWGTSATLIGNPTMTTGSTTRPRLAVNANGDAMVAWEESNGTGHSIASAYYDHLSSWQTPTYVTMDTTTAFPAVAIDGSGNAYAGWQQSPSPFRSEE